MPNSYVYLALDIFTLLGPLLLSFDKRVAFYKDWKFLFPALAMVSSVYILWDIAFTLFEIWSFNSEYLMGIFIWHLPIEEWLFFLVVPYACLFIYRCLETYFPKLQGPQNVAYYIALSGFTLITIANYDKLYTGITFGLLSLSFISALAIPLFRKIIKEKFKLISLTWLVSAIPMFYVNGKLTSLPVVVYDNSQNLAFRLGTIPVEDFFYNLLYIFWLVILYETFKKSVKVPKLT